MNPLLPGLSSLVDPDQRYLFNGVVSLTRLLNGERMSIDAGEMSGKPWVIAMLQERFVSQIAAMAAR
ncbi:hypothetical protein NKI20_19415 [Mesorhizobium sp. M0830]|uniref:hypothetical protein n=1 Tax=Mesorhizobium sp. M0830 TaxID=2957008 RepID=UPI00333515CA